MKPYARNLLAGVALACLLSACSGGVDAVAPPTGGTTTPPPTTTLAQQIGAAFNALFTASADVEATDPAPTSVPPLTLTAEAQPG